MEKKLDRILNSTPCTTEKEMKILALAEGRVNDDKDKLELFRHMAGCDSCRYLYEDFFLAGSPEAENVHEDVPDRISLAVNENGYIPRSLSRHIPGQTAVLSRSPQKQIEFRSRMGSEDLQLRFIMGKKYSTLEIDSPGKGHRYYLIHGDDYELVETSGGTATFERISRGRYILSDNLKHFIFIELQVQ